MIKHLSTSTWQLFTPWARATDAKVRAWVGLRRREVWDQLNEAQGLLQSARYQVLNSDELAPNLLELQEAWEQLSFRTKVQIGEKVYRSCTHLMRQLLGAEIHEVSLSAGTMRFWKTSKDRPATVLFFHGFGDSMDGSYQLALHLAPYFNLIVPDLPGFGQSFKRLDLPHNYASYSEWLNEFVQAAAIGPVHVVGNSLGGAVALLLALERPDLVQSLTLLNSAAITDFENGSIYDELLKGQVLFQVQTEAEFELFWARVFHRQPMVPPFVKDYMLQMFRDNHDWYGHLIKQIFAGVSHENDPGYKELFLNERLPQMHVPTLIIWGDQDKLFPVSFGARGHALLPDSRFIVLKNVGHAPQVEAPGVVAKHLRAFIASLAPRLAS